MREIKFRAWHTKEKRWLDAGKFDATHNLYFWEQVIKSGYYELTQYTGLKDKNGKEIYEGDIINFQMTRVVLVDHPIMTATTEETAIYQGEVKWSEYGFRPFIDGKASEIEVIGNIYENPELLNTP